jgi:ABC-2 type transport system ATP-binding protein
VGTSDELKDRVGGERLEVRVAEEEMAPRAAETLAPLCGEGPPTIEGTLVKLTIRHRTGLIVEAVRRLDEAGVAVEDLGLRRPTLDDVFLSLTGHAAEEEDGAEEQAA